MNDMSNQGARTPDAQAASRRPYQSPTLSVYGKVASLTQSGSCNESNDNLTGTCAVNNNKGMNASDRRLKTDIVRVGSHPMGFGLYLFSYLPEYQAQWGEGRQFGVMADEVEQVLPQAVGEHPDGYKVVCYGMLGISKTVH